MKLFSQRNGIVSVKDSIQKESMDQDLRVGIWNVLKLFVWDSFKYDFLKQNKQFHLFFQSIWIVFLKYPVDTLNDYWKVTYGEIRETYFKFKWFQIYDFLEFTVDNYPGTNVKQFIKGCNIIFERELSAYRFVGSTITEITSKEEIQEIEKAMADSPNTVQLHLNSALKLLGDKKNPDYRNSIKESISGVESICKKISGDDKATLGKALTLIEKNGKVQLHSALKSAFSKLYGYTNDEGGIRHALLEEDKLDFEDAKFMLVSCSAFINYLIIKGDKAGIKF